jgi:predicted TIM-barrel fold metal-dependent hydrolase
MRTYKVISADGHVEVPADMWLNRVPAKYMDIAPKMVIHDDYQWWKMGDVEMINVGNMRGGMLADEIKPGKLRYRGADGALRPGTGDGKQRLREQDKDGLDAEVLYPPVYGPAFLRGMLKENKDAYLSFVQAYNSFLGEDFCAVAPDRLIGNFILPETGVDDAIAEVERCKKMGLKSVCPSMWPNGTDEYDDSDDKFFAAILDMDVKLSPHGTFGGQARMARGGRAPKFPTHPGLPLGLPTSGSNRNSILSFGTQGPGGAISELMLHGVLDRFPNLQIYFAETQAGWLPHSMTMVDDFYLRWYPFYDIKLKMMPSDYYRQNCKFSFIHDAGALPNRYQIGIDMLMWGSDLPHGVSDFPDSRDILAELFHGVPEDEKRQILVGNVCEFFDLDAEKPITETPQASK